VYSTVNDQFCNDVCSEEYCMIVHCELNITFANTVRF